MAISPRHARIGGATVMAVLLVAGAYVLPSISVPQTKEVNAELTDELLATYVSKDSDQDDLPDWQEALYGTDSAKADTDGDGITDGEAVRRGLLTPTSLASQLPAADPIGEEDIPGEAPAPGSLTDQFARAFFEAYIRASDGQPMSAEAQQEVIASLLTKFQADAAKSLVSPYSLVSVRTGSGGATPYAGQVERVLESAIPDSPDSDVILLVQRVIEKSDQSAVARLAELEPQYAEAVSQLLEVPAPPAARESHLMLVRSLDQTRRAMVAVQDYEKDPILTMGALQALNESLPGTVAGLTGIAQQVLGEGEPAPGMPGSLTVEAVRRMQTQ